MEGGRPRSSQQCLGGEAEADRQLGLEQAILVGSLIDLPVPASRLHAEHESYGLRRVPLREPLERVRGPVHPAGLGVDVLVKLSANFVSLGKEALRGLEPE
jgi:hypothetical protein